MIKSGGFEKYFRVISYLVALSGLFALFVSGGVGILVFSGFLAASLFAWFLEDTKWQLSERLAVTVVGASVLLFFLDWQFNLTGIWSGGIFAAAGLARLILFLAAIKLLQKKADKDWIFIYIISFFEVLLAAGLSISPLYLISLFSFLFFTTCSIIAFEIRRSSRAAAVPAEEKAGNGIKRIVPESSKRQKAPAFRLPAVSVVLLALITLIGLPIFFALPRGNAAGFGNDLSDQVNVTGFSDTVTLGTIGALQRSDRIVMRVRIDQNNNQDLNRLLWRGVALDRFDNRRWTKSNSEYRQPFVKNDKNLVLFDYPSRNGQITIQTFYLEPISTNVLFSLKRPFALQGVGLVNRDSEGALLSIRGGNERLSYSVYSDTSVPKASVLKRDKGEYTSSHAKYLQMPEDLDPRIAELAETYIRDSGATNGYDIAETIEARLSDGFGYSLDMKARGPQPVADFLFNVKTGHCEYFASAMVMMLRTQGIASRVVNGFQSGDYNETAGVYVVRQQNAHSWVEVFFPATNSWVAFDPTPPDSLAGARRNSFFGVIAGYLEALETFWIQYVVAYDGQEQKSLLRRFRDGVGSYMVSGSTYLESTQSLLNEWWQQLRGDEGAVAVLRAAGIGLGLLLLAACLLFAARLLWRLLAKLRLVRWLASKLKPMSTENRVEFYDRMEKILAKGGYARQKFQTPFEFAESVGIKEVQFVTNKYHMVRFGGLDPDAGERREIDEVLALIKERVTNRDK